MKYNKQWRSLIEEFQIDERHILSYSDWKKRIRKRIAYLQRNWMCQLFKECDAIDNLLFSSSKKSRCYDCLHTQDKVGLTIAQRNRLCEINKKTLYKLCKKIDKKLLGYGDTAKNWYSWLEKNQRYKFLGCPELTYSRLFADADSQPYECPVCLEPIQYECGKLLVCNHVFCKDCMPHLGKTCPLCRQKLSLQKITYVL